MNETDIEGAEEALKVLKEHHRSCEGRCKNMGWGNAPRGPEKRCDEGTLLYDRYMSFRPSLLAGEWLPDTDDKVHVEKHVLGNITVWAYKVDASKSSSVKDWREHGELRHAIYLDGELQRIGIINLDDALITALGDKYRGTGSGAAYYAALCLGIPYEG